jgi:hypothetical protein
MGANGCNTVRRVQMGLLDRADQVLEKDIPPEGVQYSTLSAEGFAGSSLMICEGKTSFWRHMQKCNALLVLVFSAFSILHGASYMHDAGPLL